MSNWSDLVLIHGNIEGARAAFELACEKIIRAKHKPQNVKGVRASQGDGGIDVYVGELGVGPVDVFQCKYFVSSVDKSQRQQIQNSYKAAMSSTIFSVKSWTLCLPINLSIAEAVWFDGWAEKSPVPVTLLPPADMIEWAESAGLASSIFKRKDSIKLDWLVAEAKAQNRDPWTALVEETESDCYNILLSLLRKHHSCVKGQHSHLDDMYLKAESGDRLYTCEYVKSVLVGVLPDNHKIWLLNMLTDLTLEPLAYKFIRRYDAIIDKAEYFNRMKELSTSEFYSTWGMIRSPALKSLRDRAGWLVGFS